MGHIHKEEVHLVESVCIQGVLCMCIFIFKISRDALLPKL